MTTDKQPEEAQAVPQLEKHEEPQSQPHYLKGYPPTIGEMRSHSAESVGVDTHKLSRSTQKRVRAGDKNNDGSKGPIHPQDKEKISMTERTQEAPTVRHPEPVPGMDEILETLEARGYGPQSVAPKPNVDVKTRQEMEEFASVIVGALSRGNAPVAQPGQPQVDPATQKLLNRLSELEAKENKPSFLKKSTDGLGEQMFRTAADTLIAIAVAGLGYLVWTGVSYVFFPSETV